MCFLTKSSQNGSVCLRDFSSSTFTLRRHMYRVPLVTGVFSFRAGILSNIFKSPQNRLQTETLPPLDQHAQKVNPESLLHLVYLLLAIEIYITTILKKTELILKSVSIVYLFFHWFKLCCFTDMLCFLAGIDASLKLPESSLQLDPTLLHHHSQPAQHRLQLRRTLQQVAAERGPRDRLVDRVEAVAVELRQLVGERVGVDDEGLGGGPRQASPAQFSPKG